MMEDLLSAVAANDERAVQDAVFSLGSFRNSSDLIPDEVTDALLDILTRKEIQNSELSGHLLNFFEFEASNLSSVSKNKCRAFLKRWGDYFNTVHGMQVVTELRHSKYLNA